MKRSAHSKAVLDDSSIVVDTTSLSSTQTILLHDRSYLSHSESEQYKFSWFKVRSGHQRFAWFNVWPSGSLVQVTDTTKKKINQGETMKGETRSLKVLKLFSKSFSFHHDRQERLSPLSICSYSFTDADNPDEASDWIVLRAQKNVTRPCYKN